MASYVYRAIKLTIKKEQDIMETIVILGYQYWLKVAKRDLEEALASKSKKIRVLAENYKLNNPKGYRVEKVGSRVMFWGFHVPRLKDLRKRVTLRDCELPLFGSSR